MNRTRERDACPGALQVHQAADGALARVRLPGGVISATQLDALADASARFGAGTLEITVRGNVQVRGISDTAAVAAAVAAAGLLPSATHERVRNIVASPLSGRLGGLADVRKWVMDLDLAIQRDPVLAGLPGRFWFSLDDGSADVSGLAADVGVHVLRPGGQERSDPGINTGGQERVALLLAGRDTGVRITADEAVPTLVAVARRFLELRGNSWRISELDDSETLLSGFHPTAPAGGRYTKGRPRVGWIEQSGGSGVALGAAVPLGVLTARQAQFVAAIGAPLVITPFRSLLVCDLDEEVADTSLRVLAPLGLIFDEDSPWLAISACVGSPGCERSRADVRADAARAARTSAPRDPGTGPVHFAGCERACGRPPSGEVLVATGDGYRPLPTVG